MRASDLSPRADKSVNMVDKINVFLKTRETELLDQKLSEAQNFDLYRATENYKAGLLLLPLWSVLLYILRFSLRNLLSQNLVHNFLQPIKSEKRQFYAWIKRFVQSRRTCQKYWVFTPYPSPTPSVYLKLSFVVGCLNILKGVWSSIVKLISQN